MRILSMNISPRHPRSLFAVFLVAALLFARGVAFAEEIPITLDRAVRDAIERNLALRVQMFAPALSETGVRRAPRESRARVPPGTDEGAETPGR